MEHACNVRELKRGQVMNGIDTNIYIYILMRRSHNIRVRSADGFIPSLLGRQVCRWSDTWILTSAFSPERI